MPEHLIPVIPTPETVETMRLWNVIKTQVKVAPFGGVYALDLGSISQVFMAIGVEDIPGELEKMQMIFQEVYGKEK